MKKQLIIIFGLLLTCMSTRAQTQYITGSSAIRPVVIDAIESLFDHGPTTVVTRGNLDEHQAKYSVLAGTIGNVPVTWNCLWSSSDAGIAAASLVPISDVDFNGNLRTIPDAPAYFLNLSASGRSASLPSATETNTTSTLPDFTLADASKSVSVSMNANFITFGSDSSLGVVPFVWVKCTNSASFAVWSHFTNVTHDQLVVQLDGPQVAAFFTGIPADTNVNVYTIGGNPASGPRKNVLVDAYQTISPSFLDAFHLVDQWAVNPAGPTPGVFAGPYLEAVDATIPGYNLVEVSTTGFDTGSDISKDLSIDGCSSATDPLTGNTGVITMGYLTIPDATTNSIGTNLWLTLNGVLESDNAIAQGQYSLWGYEHLYGSRNADVSLGNELYTAIENKIANIGNGDGEHSVVLSLQYMECTKGSDWAYPIHN